MLQCYNQIVTTFRPAREKEGKAGKLDEWVCQPAGMMQYQYRYKGWCSILPFSLDSPRLPLRSSTSPVSFSKLPPYYPLPCFTPCQTHCRPCRSPVRPLCWQQSFHHFIFLVPFYSTLTLIPHHHDKRNWTICLFDEIQNMWALRISYSNSASSGELDAVLIN